MRLDCRNHARNHILSPQQPPGFGLDTRPGTGGKFAQQFPVKTSVNSQTFGNGKNHLSVRNGQTNIFGDVDGGQQSPLLVAGGTGAPLLAGIGNKHLMLTVRATNASEALVQIPTLEKSCYRSLNDWPPETVLALITFIVDLLERVKMLVDQTPQV